MKRILYIVALFCLSPTASSGTLGYSFQVSSLVGPQSLTGMFTAVPDALANDGRILKDEIESFTSRPADLELPGLEIAVNDENSFLSSFRFEPEPFSLPGPILEFQIGTAVSHELKYDVGGCVNVCYEVVIAKKSQFGNLVFDSERFLGELTVDTLPAPVPAPATLALFGLGLAGLGISRRKRNTQR